MPREKDFLLRVLPVGTVKRPGVFQHASHLRDLGDTELSGPENSSITGFPRTPVQEQIFRYHSGPLDSGTFCLSIGSQSPLTLCHLHLSHLAPKPVISLVTSSSGAELSNPHLCEGPRFSRACPQGPIPSQTPTCSQQHLFFPLLCCIHFTGLSKSPH